MDKRILFQSKIDGRSYHGIQSPSGYHIFTFLGTLHTPGYGLGLGPIQTDGDESNG